MSRLRDKVTKLRLAIRSLENLLAWESVGNLELMEAVVVEVRVVGPKGVLWCGRKDLSDADAGEE